MKIIVLSGALLAATSATSEPATPCSQPQPAFGQSMQLTRALSSEEFQEALSKQVENEPSVMIADIEFGNGVRVKLSNDCIIEISEVYAPPTHSGLCPELDRTEALTTCDR